MTKVLLQLLIAAGILSTTLFTIDTFAENANCSIDCEAPTIGDIDNGQRVVENGLAINDNAFNVEHQIQTIPTTQLETGKTATVQMTVYENNGVSSLRHVSLTISDYQDDVTQNDMASISFNQDFSGEQTVDVMDPNDILKDVQVKTEDLDEFRTQIEFSFMVVKPFDTSDLIVDMWDDDRSARTNVFLEALQATGEPIVEFVPEPQVYVPPPLKQMAEGVAAEDVECREGLELVIRTTGAPACVYPATAKILQSWGMVA
jgi:hypothetical protein